MLSTKEIKRIRLSTVPLNSCTDLGDFLEGIGAELVNAGVPGKAADKIVNEYIFKKHCRVNGIFSNGRVVYITGPDKAVRDLAGKAALLILKKGLV